MVFRADGGRNKGMTGSRAEALKGWKPEGQSRRWPAIGLEDPHFTHPDCEGLKGPKGPMLFRQKVEGREGVLKG